MFCRRAKEPSKFCIEADEDARRLEKKKREKRRRWLEEEKQAKVEDEAMKKTRREVVAMKCKWGNAAFRAENWGRLISL